MLALLFFRKEPNDQKKLNKRLVVTSIVAASGVLSVFIYSIWKERDYALTDCPGYYKIKYDDFTGSFDSGAFIYHFEIGGSFTQKHIESGTINHGVWDIDGFYYVELTYNDLDSDKNKYRYRICDMSKDEIVWRGTGAEYSIENVFLKRIE